MKRTLALILTLVSTTALQAGPQSPAVIVAWNELAYDIGYGEDQFRTFKALRSMAMMHLAMHDAIDAGPPPHRIAAAARAAHDVLLAQYPDARARLDAELARWAGPNDGVERGRASAAAILAARANDGWDYAGTYEFRSEPGAYQTTPGWNGFVLQPGFRFARPFVLMRPDQFRPPPPPPLDSAEYARALEEVTLHGSRDSGLRTADQSAYAVWWMEFSEGSVNRLARRLVTDRGLHLRKAARMFALLNAALYDAYVATWDAKYAYNHWRPYTAIRASGDSEWDSLKPAPPFPEYSSAHAAGCSSSFAVLEDTFGGRMAFEMETITAPPGMKARRFESFRAAAAECADSRVQLGWHFRYATDAGLVLGRAVAESVMRSVK